MSAKGRGGPIYVYLLSNPVNKLPFYVGLTNDLETRLDCHLEKEQNTAKGSVLSRLRQTELEAQMVVVDKKPDRETASRSESAWIKKYRDLGFFLTNTPSSELARIAADFHVAAIDRELAKRGPQEDAAPPKNRHGAPWSAEDLASVEKDFLDNIDVVAIAKRHGRTKDSILFQLTKIAGHSEAVHIKLETGRYLED